MLTGVTKYYGTFALYNVAYSLYNITRACQNYRTCGLYNVASSCIISPGLAKTTRLVGFIRSVRLCIMLTVVINIVIIINVVDVKKR